MKYNLQKLLRGVFFAVCMALITQPFSVASSYIDKEVKNASFFSDPQLSTDKNILHFFTHGRPGELLINGDWHGKEKLVCFLENYLKNNPDVKQINIYGCEFAKGMKGREVVDHLRQRLKVIVAASTNVTGKDGDWKLEVGDENNTALTFDKYQGNLQCAGVAGGMGPNDDFDGDGVCNSVDLDDDNDGILDTIETTQLCSDPALIGWMTNAGVCYGADQRGFWWLGETLTTGTNSTFLLPVGSQPPKTVGRGIVTSGGANCTMTTKLGVIPTFDPFTANHYVEFNLTTSNYDPTYNLLLNRFGWNGNSNPKVEVRISQDNFATYTTVVAPKVVDNTSIYFDQPYQVQPNKTYNIRIYLFSIVVGIMGDAALNGICFSDINTDNTDNVNRFDLDSDNDGCSDANEYYNSSSSSGTDGGAFGTSPLTVDATGKVTGTSDMPSRVPSYNAANGYSNVINAAVFTACCELTSASLTVTPTNATTCINGTGSLAITNGGLLANRAYSVSYTVNGVVSTANITSDATSKITIPNLAPGSYSNVIVSSTTFSPCSATKSGPFVIGLPPAPSVVVGTISPICQGSVSFALPYSSATGSPNQYAVSGGITASGALTTSPITVPISNTLAAGTYSLNLVVTNANGCSSAGIPFSLTINPKPAVTAPVYTDYCNGASVPAKTLVGNPSGVVYDVTGGSAVGLPNQSNVTTIPGFSASNGTGSPVTATITITPKANGCVGTAQTFTITVNPTPSVTVPTYPAFCNGASVPAQTISGAPTGATYDITGGSSIGLSDQSGVSQIPAFTATNNGGTAISATLTITPKANGCSGVAKTFNITVNPSPGISAGAVEPICQGITSFLIPFSAVTGGANQYSLTSSLSGFTPVSNAALPTSPLSVNIPGNAGPGTYTFNLTVKNSTTGCSSVSIPVSLVINPAPTVTAPVYPDLCKGEVVPAQSLTGSPSGVVYDISGGSSVGLSNQTGVTQIPSFTAIYPGSNTPITITVTPKANGCSGTPVTFTIKVNPTPSMTLGTIPAVCPEAGSFSIPFSSTVNSPNQYSVTSSDIAGFTPVTNAALPASPINVPLPGSIAPGSYNLTLSLTNSVTGCKSADMPIALTVKSSPVIVTPSNAQYCNGEAVPEMTLTGTPSGVRYDISGGASIGLFNQNNVTNIGAFTAQNTGSSIASATITVTPKAGGCTGTPVIFTVSVKPTAVASDITIADTEICSGSTATLSATSTSVINPVFQWYSDASLSNQVSTGDSYTTPVLTANATYYVSVSGDNKCENTAATASSVVVIVNRITAITQQPLAAVNPVCEGDGLNLQVAADGSDLTYQWRKDGIPISGATAASYSKNAVDENDEGSYDVVVSGACGTVTSNPIAVQVNTAVTFTGASSGDQTVCEDGSTSFTVNASGNNLTYQWQENKTGSWTNISNGGIYSGATTAQLTLTGVTDDMNEYMYRAVVKSGERSCPDSEKESSPSLLNVNTPVEIVDQPDDQISCTMGVATFSVAASGTNLNYQWQVSSDGGTTYTDVTDNTNYQNSNTSLLIVSNIPFAFSGNKYRAVVSSGDGSCGQQESDGALLTVYPPLTELTIHQEPQDKSVCVLGTTTLTLDVSGAGSSLLTYQWNRRSGPGAAWVAVTDGSDADGTTFSGSTTANLTVSNVSAQKNGYEFQCVLSSGTCDNYTSQSATLEVNSLPIITSESSDNNICEEKNAIFKVVAEGTNLNYQWQEDSGNGFADLVDAAGSYQGSTTTDLELVNVPESFNGYKYRVLVRSGDGSCGVATSGAKLLTVNQNVSITAQPAATATSICEGGTTTLTVAATGSNLTYQWRKGLVDIPGANSSTLELNNAMVDASGSYDVEITGICGTEVSQGLTITINPTPTFTTQNTAVSCKGENNGSISVSPTEGSIGDYQYSKDNGVTWQTSNVFGSLAPGTYQIVTSNNASNCPSSSVSVTITEPELLVANLNAVDVTCKASANSSISLTVMGGEGPYSYLWNDMIGTKDRSGLAPGNYSVTVTDANGCNVNQTATITEPDALVSSIEKTDANCNGANDGSLNLTVSGGSIPYTYLWNQGATTEDITGLATGTFSVTVTDSKGCQIQDQAMIEEPVAIAFSTTVTQPDCQTQTGEIAIDVTSGSGLEFSVDGMTYQTSQSFSGLGAGSYTVSARNIVNPSCLSTESAVVNSAPIIPAIAQVTVSQPVSCAVPTGTITVTSPVGNYEYSINGSDFQTATEFSGLAAGNYSITTRSTEDPTCTSITMAQTIDPAPTAPEVATVTVTQPVSCAAPTGTIEVTAPLGAEYEYSINGADYQTSATFSGLTAGDYMVTTRKAADPTCNSVTATQTIDPAPTAPEVAAVTVTQPASCAAPTGSIEVNAPLGAEYEYSINGTDFQTNTEFSGLTAGDYMVTTRKAADPTCNSVTTTQTIDPAPTAPEVATVTVTQPAGCAMPTGTIEVTAPLGAEYEYSINGTDFQTNPEFTGLSSGDYMVTTRKAADATCNSVTTAQTINPAPTAPVIATVTITQPASCAAPTGTIEVTAPLGAEYEYSINGTDFQTSTEFSGLTAGDYMVTTRKAADPTCNSVTTPQTIVSPGACAPIAKDDEVTGNINTPAVIQVTRNDMGEGSSLNLSTLDLDPSVPGVQTSITTASGTWTVTAPGEVTFNPVAGFEGITSIDYTISDNLGHVSNVAKIIVNMTSMPVNLTSFTGKATTEGNQLRWTTSEEKNFDRFIVEQSTDIKSGFEELGFVKGGGDTYHFLDKDFTPGNTYYRLKMVDMDGSFDHSGIIKVYREYGPDEFKLFPNPSISHTVYIHNYFPLQSHRIYDFQGKPVKYKMTTGAGKYIFAIDPDAPAGVYVLEYQVAGQQVRNKFILLK